MMCKSLIFTIFLGISSGFERSFDEDPTAWNPMA